MELVEKDPKKGQMLLSNDHKRSISALTSIVPRICPVLESFHNEGNVSKIPLLWHCHSGKDRYL